MEIIPLEVGPFEVNCFLVWNKPEETLVIDPGAEAGNLGAALERRGLTPAAVLLTHGHIDHLSALPEFQKRYPVPVYLHEGDHFWPTHYLTDPFPPYGTLPEIPKDLRGFPEGGSGAADVVLPEAPSIPFSVYSTPGHSKGSCCFLFEGGHLFSGDTLFWRSIGRTDFEGGSFREIKTSLNVLRTLPPELRVYPGHGPFTTLADELESNPFFLKF